MVHYEGTNIEVMSQVKAVKTSCDTYMSSIKENYIHNNYDAAISDCDNLILELKTFKINIKATEDTALSNVGGFILSLGLNFKKKFGNLSSGDLSLDLGDKFGIFDDFRKNFDKMKELTDTIYSASVKVNKDFIGNKNIGNSVVGLKNSANMYKNSVIGTINDLIAKTTAIKFFLKKSKENYEKRMKNMNKPKTECVDKEKLLFAKKALYESYSKGEISLEEREELLHSYMNEAYINESIGENTNMSNYEKFNFIKQKMYTECSEGKISLSQREALIDSAYNKYMKKK